MNLIKTRTCKCTLDQLLFSRSAWLISLYLSDSPPFDKEHIHTRQNRCLITLPVLTACQFHFLSYGRHLCYSAHSRSAKNSCRPWLCLGPLLKPFLRPYLGLLPYALYIHATSYLSNQL